MEEFQGQELEVELRERLGKAELGMVVREGMIEVELGPSTVVDIPVL